MLEIKIETVLPEYSGDTACQYLASKMDEITQDILDMDEGSHYDKWQPLTLHGNIIGVWRLSFDTEKINVVPIIQLNLNTAN